MKVARTVVNLDVLVSHNSMLFKKEKIRMCVARCIKIHWTWPGCVILMTYVVPQNSDRKKNYLIISKASIANHGFLNVLTQFIKFLSRISILAITGWAQWMERQLGD